MIRCKMGISVWLAGLALVGSVAGAQEKIKPLSVLTEIPKTSWLGLKTAFSKEAIGPWVAIIGSTAVLYHYDEEILMNFQYQGRQWGIGNSDNTKTVAKYSKYDLLRLPSDTGSTLYFLGDGWTHLGIAVGFAATGQFSGSTKAWNTGLEMVHGMITSTIFNQALKRSTGRESPSQSTSPRGTWRPFPSIAAYGAETARYDAMPSGHIMTATLVFTVIHGNYPEYAIWTLPIAGVWLSALGFQMVNNGVHWASDYPLGIAMGYLFGKISLRLGEPETPNADKKEETASWQILPGMDHETTTLNLIVRY